MIEPIKRGARGSAVEDVQKRLLTLGYDLGPTGVDGVFLGATWDAVRGFQSEHDLAEDGEVGPETWSALVDATFQLGDRLLYLRFPYFHGRDVTVLQGALNALGFACGTPDGIFGAYTERAVREFQSNVAQSDDGIVGTDTVRAIERLHHIWQGKESSAVPAMRLSAARTADVLIDTPVDLCALDEVGGEVADRVANIALATEPRAHTVVRDVDMIDAKTVVRIGGGASGGLCDGLPRLAMTSLEDDTLEPRLLTALSAVPGHRDIVVDVTPALLDDETARQRVAVRLLDALCAALTRGGDLW